MTVGFLHWHVSNTDFKDKICCQCSLASSRGTDLSYYVIAEDSLLKEKQFKQKPTNSINFIVVLVLYHT